MGGVAPLTASVRVISALLRATQLDDDGRARILERIGVAPALLEDIDARVPYEQLMALFDAAAAGTGDPDWGLHAPALIPVDAFGVVGYAAMHSANLGDALDRVIRAYRLMVDGIALHMAIGPDLARFTHDFPEHARRRRHSQEFSFAVLVHQGRQLSGVDWVPRHVAFPHPRPPDTRAHERFFRCPLAFGQARAELIFDPSVAALPFTDRDPGLLEILDRHIYTLMDRLPPANPTFADRVREQIVSHLASGPPSIDEVASLLSLSRRTLQRRLAAEGRPFAELVDEVRRSVATAQLRGTRCAISEIAFLTGYAEMSAFYRAFRRWTGQTPAGFRRAARA